ncbi:MAG: TonB-dependent receptor plug domain-containing protein, partial [Opitutaceae bacterium]
VTSVRRDIYGNSIPNPTGQDREYGLELSTKDNRFFLRVSHFDTLVTNGTSTLSNPGGIGSTIAQGLRWRNVWLYQLGGYTLDTQNEVSYRNTWTNAYPGDLASDAITQQDAAIAAWNNIQAYLQPTGFFKAWGFTPTTQSALTTRSQYLTNPSAYQPDPATVYAYSAVQPQGFTVTANQESKGWEFDATANPVPQWRISFNAAEATAVQENVGGTALNSLAAYLNSQIYTAGGPGTGIPPAGVPNPAEAPAGYMPQYGNASLDLAENQWGPWYAGYTLLKLQEGSDVSELRKWSYKLITNYTFDHGILKDLGVGGGYRWQDRDVIGYPVNSTTGSFELNQPYYGPSLGYVDLWASYAFKLKDGIRDRLQVNVYNVGKRNGLIPVSIEPDGHTWAAVRIAPVQEWELTNTIDF